MKNFGKQSKQEQTPEQQASDAAQNTEQQAPATQEQSTDTNPAAGEQQASETQNQEGVDKTETPVVDEKDKNTKDANQTAEKESEEKVATPEQPAKTDMTPEQLPTTDDSINGIVAVLADSSITPIERLVKIANSSNFVFASLAKYFIGLEDSLGADKPNLSEQVVIGKHYDLFNRLINTLEEENYSIFKIKFDIVNLAFRVYAKSSCNEFRLCRYDEKWKWGDVKKSAYLNLVTVITTLCDIEKRKHELKHIDLTVATNQDKTGITAKAAENIKKYYIA